MEIEVWKDVKGYEGLYQVSNLGRLKSLEKSVKYVARLPKPKFIKRKERILTRSY